MVSLSSSDIALLPALIVILVSRSPSSMKLAYAKALSHKSLPSHHQPERCEHNHSTNNVMRNVAKRRANRWPTTDDIKHFHTMGHSPHPMDSLQVMGSPPSYPPNAIVRCMAGCTQVSQSKSGPHAKPFGPSLSEFRFIGKSLAMSDQSELLLIEAQVAKDILQCGLQHMSDDAIQQAAHAKQASHETRRLCIASDKARIGLDEEEEGNEEMENASGSEEGGSGGDEGSMEM
ncbi:hypothetical protein BD769DRAFT_1680256 [Suillus cothurnatus]|nr:hypothetical protein BD769DRAFT_1680256 [Suillus cothurnatus]